MSVPFGSNILTLSAVASHFGEFVTRCMTQHVRVDGKLKPGLLAGVSLA
jgi:hypothetical protein